MVCLDMDLSPVADAVQQSVLVVDDDPDMLAALHTSLAHQGLVVSTALSGQEALTRLESESFDVVVSDIAMPGFDGLSLLRHLHDGDATLPVILLTGSPSLPSALMAIEHGVYRYLLKPPDRTALAELVKRAAATRRLQSIRQQLGSQLLSLASDKTLELGRLEGFSQALERVYMAFQPIVDLGANRIRAYEALLRCDDPDFASPATLLDAAERLGRVLDLGRVVRARSAAALREAPPTTLLFVNLHPAELQDPELLEPRAPLSRVAHRVVLEITERARLGPTEEVHRTLNELRRLGFRVALDDMGAGYAGLTSLVSMDPNYVKLDMSLVRDIDQLPTKQRLVHAMVDACVDLGQDVIAEGVETAAERDALLDIGVTLLQGYFFARPQRGFVDLAFE